MCMYSCRLYQHRFQTISLSVCSGITSDLPVCHSLQPWCVKQLLGTLEPALFRQNAFPTLTFGHALFAILRNTFIDPICAWILHQSQPLCSPNSSCQCPQKHFGRLGQGDWPKPLGARFWEMVMHPTHLWQFGCRNLGLPQNFD